MLTALAISLKQERKSSAEGDLSERNCWELEKRGLEEVLWRLS